ncbi:MAG: S-layer homology domain-containing protein [Actinomycetota bacterium]
MGEKSYIPLKGPRDRAVERRMDHGRRIWSLVVTALLASVVVAVPLASPAAAADPWIDTSDRDAVLAAWQTEFGRAEPDMGFTGDVDTCTAGTTSQAYRNSVLQRVNWYRRMAGMDTVSENATFSSHNQQAALMMSAEGSLSHSPGAGWECYTANGATAAGKSNLALGLAGVEAIDAYMQDFGAGNTKVGHRRTILYPQVQEMGSGDVPFGSSSWASNTLYVFDSHLWDARPDVREERDFVAWPPSGYVPAETVWGRWSFSLARADFSTAAVTVTGPDGPVSVQVLERIQSGGLIAPEAAIVFAVDGDTNSAVFDTPTNGDECYAVTISGVTMNGSPMDPFDYSTCLLDPTSTIDPIGFDPASGSEVCPGLTYSAWTTPCWAIGSAQNLPFPDVTTSWQLAPVGWMVANDITTGVAPNRFDPNGFVTRAQAATFIWRMAGRPAPPADAPTFNDVPAGAYYEQAVRWMAATGITAGTSPTEFSPNQVATRAHLATFLWRLVDQPFGGDASQFVDVTAHWQQGPIGWAASVGVTTGTTSTTFDPNSGVTRGQTAAMLARLAAALAAEAAS